MSALVWTKSFEVGVPTIDTQHQKLIELINQLDLGASTGSADEIRKATLGVLDYARVHFAYEEGRMEACSYAGRAEHLKLHTEFMKHAMDAYRKLLAGDGSVARPLAEYLRNWLLTHIVTEDRKVAAALIEFGGE